MFFVLKRNGDVHASRTPGTGYRLVTAGEQGSFLADLKVRALRRHKRGGMSKIEYLE